MIVIFLILEHELSRTLKEKEEEFSSTIEELKGKLYETETRNKGNETSSIFEYEGNTTIIELAVYMFYDLLASPPG